jgi:carbon storage regulator CsrA
MLVLSRKADQKVCFPGLGITVHILQVKGSSVRVGVDAPVEVRIMRDELQDDSSASQARTHVVRLPRELRHELRNQLNTLSLALHLFKQEIDSGRLQDAEETFDKLVEHIEQLSQNEALSPDSGSRKRSHEERAERPTALLVEDEPNEREMLAGFLRMHGYEVATASDGLEAIEYLKGHQRPTVILIDMRMPRCDGATTVRHIRRDASLDGVKIFAISGSTPEESGLNTDGDEVNRWFSKPLNPRQLVDAMASEVCQLEPSAA